MAGVAGLLHRGSGTKALGVLGDDIHGDRDCLQGLRNTDGKTKRTSKTCRCDTDERKPCDGESACKGRRGDASLH